MSSEQATQTCTKVCCDCHHKFDIMFCDDTCGEYHEKSITNPAVRTDTGWMPSRNLGREKGIRT